MFLVPRLVRPVVAVSAALCALVVLAGCGTSVDLAKKPPFPRSTVQPNAGDSSTPRTTAPSEQPADSAFATDKLRLLDPCKLLDRTLLDELGTPDVDAPYDFTSCSNYMKDKQGKPFSITIRVGASLISSQTEKANRQIGGLYSFEEPIEGTGCDVSLITQDNPALGIVVDVGYQAGDPCPPARRLAESVVRLAKQKSSTRTVDRSSLITVDPCTLPEQAVVVEAAGSEPRLSPFGMYDCSWTSLTAGIDLRFRSDYVPRDNQFDEEQVVIDLDGITAYQVDRTSKYQNCSVKWVHRKTGDTQGELVEVKSNGPKESEFDRCAGAQAFAKALLPKLPKI